MLLHPAISEIDSRKSIITEAILKGHLTPVAGRYLQPGWAYVYKEGPIPSLAYASTGNALDQMSDDENAIAYVVTTDDEDRDGDIVKPMGGHLTNYSRNPLVFFGHQEWEIPIGVCRSPDGRITVYPEENRMVDVIHFDRADPDADFVYQKCKRKILNATSIAFVPIEAWRRDDVRKARSNNDQGGQPGWYFNQWDKTEVSIVGVPSNPKAVGLEKDLMGACRDVFDREKSFMSMKLQKAWQPYCATAKGCWNGWCPMPGDTKDLGNGVVLKAVEKAAGEIGLWSYNTTTGYWKLERMCAEDQAQQWLERFQRDEPNRPFKLSRNKPSAKPPTTKSADPDPEMDLAARVQEAGKELENHKNPAPMPGYGQIFRGPNSELWYVGGDGDEDGFSDLVQEKLGSLLGVTKVTVEAEGFPPKDEGWEQLYPKQKAWSKRRKTKGASGYVEYDQLKNRSREQLVTTLRNQGDITDMARIAAMSKEQIINAILEGMGMPSQQGKSSCSCDDCSAGKACGCAKSVSKHYSTMLGQDSFTYVIDDETREEVGKFKTEQEARDAIRRWLAEEGQQKSVEKDDSEDYDAGYERGRREAEDKKRQSGSSVEPMRGKAGDDAYDLGYERGWNSVATAKAKAAIEKFEHPYNGFTIRTERVSSGWHWKVDGVGESSSPLATEDQAVEAAQEAIGSKALKVLKAATQVMKSRVVQKPDGWYVEDDNGKLVAGPFENKIDAIFASQEKSIKSTTQEKSPLDRWFAVFYQGGTSSNVYTGTVQRRSEMEAAAYGSQKYGNKFRGVAGPFDSASQASSARPESGNDPRLVKSATQADLDSPGVPGRNPNPSGKAGQSVMKSRVVQKPDGWYVEDDDGKIVAGPFENKIDAIFASQGKSKSKRPKGKSLSQSDGRVGGYTVPPGDLQTDKDQEPLEDTQSPAWTACEICHGDGNCGGCGGTGEVEGKACEDCGGAGECAECDGQGHVEKSLQRKAWKARYLLTTSVPPIGKAGDEIEVYADGGKASVTNETNPGPIHQLSSQEFYNLENQGKVRKKSVKRKQLDTSAEEPAGPTTPQVLAALYSHAKAEAAYIDQLDEEYKDSLADYRRQQVEERMDMLKYQFSRAAGPDDDIEKLCKTFEEEHDKGMTSTGPDQTVEPGEAGLVEQGQIPMEKGNLTLDQTKPVRIKSSKNLKQKELCSRCHAAEYDELTNKCPRCGASQLYRRSKVNLDTEPADGSYVEEETKVQKSLGNQARTLYESCARMNDSDYQRQLDSLKSAMAGAKKSDIDDAWSALGAVGPGSKDKIIQRIEARRGAYLRSNMIELQYKNQEQVEDTFDKAAPGTEEWAEEEAQEPEHKAEDADGMATCEQCGKPRPRDADPPLCTSCLVESVKSVEEKAGGICMCGAETGPEDESCPGCGAEVKSPEEDPRDGSGVVDDNPQTEPDPRTPVKSELDLQEETPPPMKNTDPSAEEILERYQHPKSKKWVTRKHLVSKKLMPFLKYRVAANGKKYLVRAKEPGTCALCGKLGPVDAESLCRNCAASAPKSLDDSEVKALTTKLAGAIDDLKSLVKASEVPKHLKPALKHVADTIWYVGKALTDKGKEQKNGGSGSELSDKGKEQRNGGKGSELKDKGEQQGKTLTKGYRNGDISSEVRRKFDETVAKLRRHGFLTNGVA